MKGASLVPYRPRSIAVRWDKAASIRAGWEKVFASMNSLSGIFKTMITVSMAFEFTARDLGLKIEEANGTKKAIAN